MNTNIYNKPRTSIADVVSTYSNARDRAKQRELLDIQEQSARAKLSQQRNLQQRQQSLAGLLQANPNIGEEEFQNYYEQMYPDQKYKNMMQAKNKTSSSGQWISVPSRPGWLMNKVTGEFKQDETVSEYVDPYKKTAQELKRERLDYTKDRNEQKDKLEQDRYDLAVSNRDTAIEKFKQDKGDKLFRKSQDLSKQHYQSSKEFIKQRDAFERVDVSAVDPSPAGDLALIFNYMKVLDPGSVVREGEFATASNTGSVDDRTMNIYNKVINGERLTQKQRNDFVNRAKRLYTTAEKRQDKLDKQYVNKAKLYNIPKDLVIFDYKISSQDEDAELDEIMGAQ